MPVETCQSETTLRDFLAGYLPDEESAAVSQHLETCENCGTVVSRLESGGDSLMRHLRLTPDETGTGDESADAAWVNCLSRLKELPTQSQFENEPRPTRVHHYRLLNTLGRGGMGIVYRSWHPQLHRDVALKLLATTRAADTQAVLRFQREMRAAGNLDHPAIVRALDAGESDGIKYLVMEYVDGTDLARVVRQCGPLGVEDACQVGVAAAEALHYAHEQGVVHRDVKPSNIMLTRSGHVKLLDFGLAALLPLEGTSGDGASSTGQLLGTLDYLAPEQAAGEGAVDATADVYSLGATLFKLLTAQPPHGRQDGSLLKQLRTISETPCPRVDSLRQDIPEELADVIEHMLATDPDSRLPTAEQVANALRPWADGSQLPALAQEAARHDAGPNESAAAAPLIQTIRRRTPWTMLVAITLLSGMLGVAGLWLWQNTGEGTVEIFSDAVGEDEIQLTLVKGQDVTPVEVDSKAVEVTVRAGEYEIRVPAGSDRIIVTPNVIRVMRGETLTVRVTRPPATEQQTPEPVADSWLKSLAVRQKLLQRRLDNETLGAPELRQLKRELELVTELLEQDSNEPTFQGRSFAQWRRILHRETDLQTVSDAVQAVLHLGLEDRPDETLDALAGAAERLNSDFPHEPTAMVTIVRPRKPVERPGRRPQEQPVDLWRATMVKLSSGARQLPDHLDEQLIERLNEGPGGRKLLLLSLHARLQRDQATDLWTAQLAVQAAAADGSVRAMARYLQMHHEFAADRDIRLALADEDAQVAAAAMTAMVDAKSITHPREAGKSLGRLVYDHPSSSGPGYPSAFIRGLFRTSLFSEAETRTALAAACEEIVSRWESREGQDRMDLPAAMFCGSVAVVDGISDETAARASRLLREAIDLQLTRRRTYVPTKQDRDMPWEMGLFGLTLAIAQIDGWLPESMLQSKVDPETPLGRKFQEWKEVGALRLQEPDSGLMLTWFPLEWMELELHDQAAQLKSFMSSREARIGLVSPNLRSALHYIDLALPIGISDDSGELESVLWLLLKEADDTWIPRPRMEQELLKLARNTENSTLRGEAVRKLLRADRRQTELTAFAREAIKKVDVESDSRGRMRGRWWDDWIVQVFVAGEDWTPEGDDAERLLAIATNSFSMRRMLSRSGPTRSRPAETIEQTQVTLNLITRLATGGEAVEEILRELLEGRGPQQSRGMSSEEMRRNRFYSSLRIHPDILEELLRALRAISDELSDDTKRALSQAQARAHRIQTQYPSPDPDILAAQKSIDDAVLAIVPQADQQ